MWPPWWTFICLNTYVSFLLYGNMIILTHLYAFHFMVVWFFTIVDNSHIISIFFLVPTTLEFLTLQLYEINISIQLHKCVAWPFLVTFFFHASHVYNLTKNIKFFVIPMGSTSVIFSFIGFLTGRSQTCLFIFKDRWCVSSFWDFCSLFL